MSSLKIPEFSFQSNVADLILKLEKLRSNKLNATTPDYIFWDLKKLFHLLESIQSARIEGNRTTILEAIENKIQENSVTTNTGSTENFLEILNIENALRFIDQHIGNYPINNFLIRELHKIVVMDLRREGSQTPGNYRIKNIAIQNSKHNPPEGFLVEENMQELMDFINTKNQDKFDLIKVAIAHHKFTWVHPFDNGNGRMSRLLTYAMLIKYGFRVEDAGRILNPAGLFCVDRNKYYDMLQVADQEGDEGILKWCEYVLSGLVNEIEKVDRLANYEYLKKEILNPAITYAKEVGAISEEEKKILLLGIQRGKIVASDVNELFKDFYPVKISRLLSALKDKKYLKNYPNENSKSYVVNLNDNLLMRYLMRELYNKGFVLSDTKEEI